MFGGLRGVRRLVEEDLRRRGEGEEGRWWVVGGYWKGKCVSLEIFGMGLRFAIGSSGDKYLQSITLHQSKDTMPIDHQSDLQSIPEWWCSRSFPPGIKWTDPNQR